MKQLFVTIVFIIVGSIVLPKLPLGINDDMLGIFRVLCMGYAFYAVGNCLMLIQLYFADNKGALISALSFMSVSCVGTWVCGRLDTMYYGAGFWVGTVVFSIVAFIGLRLYLRRLLYHVLCSQPVVEEVKKGVFTNIASYSGARYEKRWRKELER